MFGFDVDSAWTFNDFAWNCPADMSLDNYWRAWLSTRLMPDFDVDAAGVFKILLGNCSAGKSLDNYGDLRFFDFPYRKPM